MLINVHLPSLSTSKAVMRPESIRCNEMTDLYGMLGGVYGVVSGFVLGMSYYRGVYTRPRVVRCTLLGLVVGTGAAAVYAQLFEHSCSPVNREVYPD